MKCFAFILVALLWGAMGLVSGAEAFPHPRTDDERDWNHMQRGDYSKDAYVREVVTVATELPKVMVQRRGLEAAEEPQTFARMVSWSPALDFPAGYALTVNGALVSTLPPSFTNAPVALSPGRNVIVLTVTNKAGMSTAARTNYLIELLTIAPAAEVVSSPAVTGPWVVTNLPPAQTNPAGAAQYFTLRAPPVRAAVLERHVP